MNYLIILLIGIMVYFCINYIIESKSCGNCSNCIYGKKDKKVCKHCKK